jgi:hypothetical protein
MHRNSFCVIVEPQKNALLDREALNARALLSFAARARQLMRWHIRSKVSGE